MLPHWRLKRCVPLPGLHLPKLKISTPDAIARSMNPQYSSIFGALARCARREAAHVISNSPRHENPQPAATGSAERYTTPNVTKGDKALAIPSNQAAGSTGVP